MTSKLKVIFDVNVWIQAVAGEESEYPYLSRVPPQSSNSSADAFSLAFDAELFQVFISPHIIRNLGRVLRDLPLTEQLAEAVLDAVIDVVHLSGGSVLEPDRTAIESKDFEDNLILDLALSTGASVIVTLDKEFQAMSPWKGRLILHPREFVSNVLLRLR